LRLISKPQATRQRSLLTHSPWTYEFLFCARVCCNYLLMHAMNTEVSKSGWLLIANRQGWSSSQRLDKL
jgi:hypothetical protein